MLERSGYQPIQLLTFHMVDIDGLVRDVGRSLTRCNAIRGKVVDTNQVILLSSVQPSVDPQPKHRSNHRSICVETLVKTDVKSLFIHMHIC